MLKVLHIDIETSPNKVYSWGLFNQNIAINQIVEPGYTLCFAAKWDKEKEVIFKSTHHDGEENMVRQAWYLLDEADAVCTYNGEKFDMPTLHREFLLMGLGPPSPYRNIDLIRTVRRKFKMASNKLDYVAQQLGIGAKVKHRGMELWKECMDGEDAAWEEMKTYNIEDTYITEKLYHRLLPWISHHPNHALFIDEDKKVCPNCGSNNLHYRGTEHTLTMSYRRIFCNDCGSWARERTNCLDKEKKQTILKGA